MDQIGIRQPHVSRLIGMTLDARFLTQRCGDERDQTVEAHACAATQIDRLHRTGSSTGGPVERGEDAVQAVGNIGIVALTRPIPVHPHRAPASDQIGESVDRQIGALPRPVDREEPQADNLERIQVRERMREQLSRPLAGRVRRDRQDGGFVFGKRRGR